MTYKTFEEFFREAAGEAPFPYQGRFATAHDLYELVHAPTGAGKTATAILGWLWRRRFAPESVRASTPRRLVYCLPMRVLVEQTRDAAEAWIKKLGFADLIKTHVLMGGEDVEDWDLDPEEDAILIGTQDMLLSRALNRGFGMSRFRWPIQYGLLNNDCLWVLDEIQLMGVGLATSAQLQAFREGYQTFGQARTIWMSATLLPSWLETVDFREQAAALRTLSLSNDDYEAEGLKDRWNGLKPVEPTAVTEKEPDLLASIVREKHVRGSLTLVVVNTVDRSRKVFEALRKAYSRETPKAPRKSKPQPVAEADASPDIRLIHSRFRPAERESWMEWLKAAPPAEGRIVVSTQVVEAGVDVSARTLITELAPWPSLIQRFGRCNRRGEFKEGNGARIYWVDVAAKDDKQAAPYAKDELDSARQRLENLPDAGLKSLDDFFNALGDLDRDSLFPYDPPHVIRRKDFIDLFDTTPDLAGGDIDVSRFIREGEEMDVQVFWRSYKPDSEWPKPKLRLESPTRRELCPVRLRDFREFLTKKTAFRFDALDGKWRLARKEDVFPGQVFWINENQGGYSTLLGWSPGDSWEDGAWMRHPEEEEAIISTIEPDYDSDLLSGFGWRTIAEHTAEVLYELKTLEIGLGSSRIPWDVLRLAALWHDWGKSHVVFQSAVRDGQADRPDEWRGRRDVAKAPLGLWGRYQRKHFRHELASALGVLTLIRGGAAPSGWAEMARATQDLALYLIASHHGKVRLSIRSMPDEKEPEQGLFARGVWDDDALPAEVELVQGVCAPSVLLDLSPMQLGRVDDGSPSWVERMLGLRDAPDLGPLRLAYLEALLRASDMRASKKADQKATATHA